MAPYNENDVDQFTMILNVPATDARQWLERYDGIESAMDKYMEHGGQLPPAFAQSQTQQMDWDENLFNGDRDVYGPANRPSSFEIHAPDQPGTQRPNSRVEQWVSNNGLSEDEQMKRAIEQSAREQDTGTTDTGIKFQAVADNAYKPNLQLAPFRGMAFDMNESVAAPPDQRRKPQDGCPAFIRPSLNKSGHLAPLLTILHNIPLAREILLGREAANVDYGGEPEWWDGKPIVDKDMDNTNRGLEIFTEAQRLMAALDDTDRAYLSIDVMEAIMRENPNIEPKFADFLRFWYEGVDGIQNSDTYQSIHGVFDSELFRPQDNDEARFEQFVTLQVNFDHLGRRDHESLMSILSRLFMEYRNSSGLPYFSKLADVLIFEAEPPSNDKLGVKIPSKFNARRFLQDPPESFLDIVDRYAELDKLNEELLEQKRKLSYAQLPNGKLVGYEKLLDNCMKHLNLAPAYLSTEGDTEEAGEEDLMDMDAESTDGKTSKSEAIRKHRQKLRDELKLQKASIAQQILDVDQQLAEVQQQVNKHQQNFDIESEEDHPDTEYKLCGVSPSYDTIYVLVRPRNSDDLLVTDEDEQPQWWRIEFTHSSPCSFSHRKVHEYEARKAAFDSYESCLLVYSNPRGLSCERQELPPALRTFVEVDNENFKLELQRKDEVLEPVGFIQDDQEMTSIAVDPSYTQDQQKQSNTTDASINKPNWGGENNPPQLPPRTSQAQPSGQSVMQSIEGESPTPSGDSVKSTGQDGSGSKKRGARWAAGLKSVMSRSKSRERTSGAKSASAVDGQQDLLTDDVEQTKGAVVMAPDGKLAVPGLLANRNQNQHEEKRTKR